MGLGPFLFKTSTEQTFKSKTRRESFFNKKPALNGPYLEGKDTDRYNSDPNLLHSQHRQRHYKSQRSGSLQPDSTAILEPFRRVSSFDPPKGAVNGKSMLVIVL